MPHRLKIVIDPGHGGTTEVGGSSPNNATGPGPRHLKEKDLTLQVAGLLKQRLQTAHDVILTRSGDSNLSLADRAAVARNNHADLFLSVHFNAFSDPAVDGTEVWVAKEASPASRRFADAVLSKVVLATGVANRHVREANFGVLLPSRHDPGTAACLVEVAFLTNPQQASRLEDPAYLAQIADALANAVRAYASVAVAHAVAVGAGGGDFSSTSSPSTALWEPDPVDDERYAGATSATELERLYALPLDGVIKTVIDSDARVRGGPPDFAAQGHKKIPRFTRVRVEEVNGNYSRVSGLDGAALGWTASSNLGTFFKDQPALASADLPPVTAIAVDSSWTDIRKAVARTFNRLGGLMQTIGTQTNTDVAAVLAVWFVESAGRAHTVGQAIIRFENHLLFDLWGSQHPAEFDAQFQFATRPPRTGSGCDRRWKCHKFRADTAASFEDVHSSQTTEYKALAAATALANEATALQCISIGGPQILIRNYQMLGYSTPRQMYDAFQAGERAQVLGFFDYCQFTGSHGGLLEALRTHNWQTFATGYNGSGNAANYATNLNNAFQAATAVLATRAATAQEMEISLGNQSVDLSFPVHLIPQPDKLSCWAASMAMLVSYRRSASFTPESLAAQVGRSLRTSYSWDMLRAVRQQFGFREVSLPSNMSCVPPPSDWHNWLDQFGPLWVTVTGNPSHAVVVAGIAGDLTPAGTFIHVLNPWDDRQRFDSDSIDFHPANEGHEETYRFDQFAQMFGNMGLADYGHWRVLYLGRPAQTQALDIHDLTPEEIADAEPPRPRTAELDVMLQAPRRVLTAADVRWAPDDHSIDYRHLGVGIDTSVFTFTPALLERLCTWNHFDVTTGQDEVLFGLRGCQLEGNHTPTGFVASVRLTEAVPDHQNARCVVGVWKRSTRQFSLFQGSTVPNWVLMERYREGGEHSNLLPTGRYLFQVGTHRAGTRGEVRGAFLEAGPIVVLRTLDNLEYEIGDTWDSGDFGDNIHPARLDGNRAAPFFSSAGCQTVPGNFRDGHNTGNWSDFRTAAGLSASAPANENGRRFVYILLTGRDARLTASGASINALTRLRFGSSGADVSTIQITLRSQGHLRGGASGSFDPATKMAYLAWQRARNAATTDGVVTPSDAASLGDDLVNGRCIAVTHALEDYESYEMSGGQAPSNDEIVQEVDQRTGTHYGNYAGYVATLVNGTVFGRSVAGVTRGFLRKLQQAEAEAARAIGSQSPDFGIVSVGGYRASEGMHNWGLAVDLNYDGLPYIMHARGESPMDRELAPIYERIAQFILHRGSVVPRLITQGERSSHRTSDLYDRLKQESDAMGTYFGLMRDSARLAAAIQSAPQGFDWRPVAGSAAAPPADALQNQMMADYVMLAGRPGPAISGKSYPAARNINRTNGTPAHRPFGTRNPNLRAPELGYMNIRKEVVIALSNANLRWGAIDFGRESGDVMHFDDLVGEGAAIMSAKSALARRNRASGQSLQAAAASCAADIAVDEHTALIFSNEAPLAGRRDCDYRAVWTYTTSPSPTPFSILTYFHGNNGYVTVDAQHRNGRVPSWAHPSPAPVTPGLKYDIAGAVQASRQHPVAIIPEIGIPSSGNFWAITEAGSLSADRASLSRLIDDTWGHLARLNRPSGSPYLSGGERCPLIRRAFLAGHSGGGRALGPAAASSVALGVPTDLWLLDCTYGWGVDEYVNFCRHWKLQGHLGNDAQSSRTVIVVWTRSETTTNGGGTIIQRLRAGWTSNGQQHPGFNAVRFTQHKFCPFTGTCPPSGYTAAPGTEIVEVMQDASWDEIETCLRQFPVVLIHTTIQHDEIPLRYIPHLLSTAAVP
jgi:N-acetylmuramoyl-L-alanine amidase/peptidoglycan hydrolase-like protein with peptidoglycan-binding domain